MVTCHQTALLQSAPHDTKSLTVSCLNTGLHKHHISESFATPIYDEPTKEPAANLFMPAHTNEEKLGTSEVNAPLVVELLFPLRFLRGARPLVVGWDVTDCDCVVSRCLVRYDGLLDIPVCVCACVCVRVCVCVCVCV
jgi:hypothetical protein